MVFSHADCDAKQAGITEGKVKLLEALEAVMVSNEDDERDPDGRSKGSSSTCCAARAAWLCFLGFASLDGRRSTVDSTLSLEEKCLRMRMRESSLVLTLLDCVGRTL